MKIPLRDAQFPNSWLSLTGLWLILWVCTMLARPPLPIDETRCLSVAWEMWQNGNLLVPHLNGMPYSHKPPLLYWLILAGWKVFGVNEWWPRLLPPLFALGSVFMTLLFARRLWPERRELPDYASHLLLGSTLWALWTTVVMYDMLIVFFFLLSLLFLHCLADGKIFAWIPAGLSLGLGLLSKGPVVLLPFVLVALSAPWWRRKEISGGWFGYSVGIILTLVVAAALALSWALPAAQIGGADYGEAILWGQTTKRMIESFAHQEPWWWYLPLIPALLFPWTVSPLFWRSLRGMDWRDSGIRFCLSWLVPSLIAYSIISGKQVYYLLPLFPAFALLLARTAANGALRSTDAWPGAVGLVLVGLLMTIIPLLDLVRSFPPWVQQISPIYGILSLFAGLLPLFPPKNTIAAFIRSSALSVVLIVGILHFGVFSQAKVFYDLRPFASVLKNMETSGHRIAHEGTYYGQFHFPGRLEKPLEVIDKRHAADWLKDHPEGRVVVYFQTWPRPVTPELAVECVRPYMGKYAAIVKVAKGEKSPPG